MKTRIRVVEYGDGRKEYCPEVKDKFKDIIVSMFVNRPNAFIIFFYIAIPLAVIWSFTWLPIINNPHLEAVNKEKYTFRKKLETAKQEIDLYYKRAEYKKTKRAEKDLRKKIVKIQLLTYP